MQTKQVAKPVRMIPTLITIGDHQLDTDGFAIRILLDTFGMNLSYTPIFDFVL